MQESFLTTSVGEQYGNIPEHLRDKIAHKIRQEPNGLVGEIYLNYEYEHESDVVQLMEFFKELKLCNVTHSVTSAQIKEMHDKSDRSAINTSSIQREIKEYFTIAAKKRASDLHITVRENGALIQIRQQGDLHIFKELNYEQGNSYCRTMYSTMCDAADKTFAPSRHQGGRIASIYLPDLLTGVRIATTPTESGYKMICRLLYDAKDDSLDLAILGYDKFQQEIIEFLMSKQSGVIIISGPTGSGKSTTLQKAMSNIIVNTNGTKHVVTVEDPPEYAIFGEIKYKEAEYDNSGSVSRYVEKTKLSFATQIPVLNAKNPQERETKFNEAISGSMRLDPDIMMIGEVRDQASAGAALKASMTGHQVWTTIHANNAITIFSRLFDIGAKVELTCNAEIVSGLMAQRLVKKLCPHCAITLVDKENNIDNCHLLNSGMINRLNDVYGSDLSNIKLVSESGCSECVNGISSLTVIAEVIKCDDILMDLARTNNLVELKRYWLQQLGGVTMQMHGILKIKRGICDPRDIEAATELLHIPTEISSDEYREEFFKRI